jgi:hypothetical protein
MLHGPSLETSRLTPTLQFERSMELLPLSRRFSSSPLTARRQIMANPGVTPGEEISRWQWIAGLAIISVLFGAFLLSERHVQVATSEAVLVPAISYPMLAR